MAATPAPDQDRIDPEVLKRALILVVGFLAVIFDTTIVSVALHTLALKLDTSEQHRVSVFSRSRQPRR